MILAFVLFNIVSLIIGHYLGFRHGFGRGYAFGYGDGVEFIERVKKHAAEFRAALRKDGLL